MVSPGQSRLIVPPALIALCRLLNVQLLPLRVGLEDKKICWVDAGALVVPSRLSSSMVIAPPANSDRNSATINHRCQPGLMFLLLNTRNRPISVFTEYQYKITYGFCHQRNLHKIHAKYVENYYRLQSYTGYSLKAICKLPVLPKNTSIGDNQGYTCSPDRG